MSVNDISKKDDQDSPSTQWGVPGAFAVSFASSISVEQITHSYSGMQVLDDVTFNLPSGGITCLLGPSGCGKTTLMRIIAGIERPKSGRVIVDEQEVVGPTHFVLPENRNIGLMFQDFALFPHLSILDNVLFGLSHLDKKLAQTQAKMALKRVGMTTYESAYPHMLSGGEQQRVALARAIAPRPAILLMDEPFSGLDHRLRDSVRAETLKILRETTSSAIIVTHDPEEAMFMADRIVLMRKGKVVQIGTPTELYKHPADAGAAKFFSDLNSLTAQVEKGQIKTPLGTFEANGFKEGEVVEVLVRPEAFYLDGENGQDILLKDIRFLGNYDLATILVKDYTEPLTAKIHGPKNLVKGETIKISLDPDQVFIFATK